MTDIQSKLKAGDKGIYAIYDKVADDLGPLTTHRHVASAIRMFSDVATNQQTMVGQHPHDYELRCLGYINSDHQIEPANDVVLTGENWVAAQQFSANGGTK